MNNIELLNEQLVRNFCSAWSRGNSKELSTYFANESTFHNMPNQPINGKTLITKTIQGILERISEIEFRIQNIIVKDNTVVVERIDRYLMDGSPTSLEVVGVFEIENGKIKAMREYFAPPSR